MKHGVRDLEHRYPSDICHTGTTMKSIGFTARQRELLIFLRFQLVGFHREKDLRSETIEKGRKNYEMINIHDSSEFKVISRILCISVALITLCI